MLNVGNGLFLILIDHCSLIVIVAPEGNNHGGMGLLIVIVDHSFIPYV